MTRESMHVRAGRHFATRGGIADPRLTRTLVVAVATQVSLLFFPTATSTYARQYSPFPQSLAPPAPIQDAPNVDTSSLNVDVGLSNGESFQEAYSWGAWSTTHDVHIADPNGDGRADLLGRDYSTGELEASLSTEDGFDLPRLWGTWSLEYDIHIGDANGDQRTDVIGWSYQTGTVQVSLSVGDSFATPSSWTWVSPEFKLYFADVTGDRRADLIGLSKLSGQITVGISDGQRFQPESRWGEVPQGTRDVEFSDISGDDRLDLVTRATSEEGAVSVSLSSGRQFAAPVAAGTLGSEYELRLADVSGDGRSDVVGWTAEDILGNRVLVGLSDGQRFRPLEEWGSWPNDHDLALGDADGDRRADQIGRTPPGRVFLEPVYNPNIRTYELPCKSGGEDVAIPHYSPGDSFEGLPKTFERRECNDEGIGQHDGGPYTSMDAIYGDCTIPEDGASCSPPLEVQTWPACERNASNLDEYPGQVLRTQIDGAPAVILGDRTQIEIYHPEATVVVFAAEPARARRAAESVERQPAVGTVEIPCTAPSQ